MNPAFILIVVISIVASIVSKKRREELKKKAEQQPAFPPQHSPNAQRKPASKPTTATRQAQPTTPAAANRNATRGVDSKWPWPTAAEKAQGKPKPAAGSTNYGGTPRYTHVVTSTLEGGHTHTESSMTGEESCPPPKPVAQKPAAVQTPTAAPAVALLDFHPNNVVQGILYSEILGKPKALRRN